jgi:hypothetical protein
MSMKQCDIKILPPTAPVQMAIQSRRGWLLTISDVVSTSCQLDEPSAKCAEFPFWFPADREHTPARPAHYAPAQF